VHFELALCVFLLPWQLASTQHDMYFVCKSGVIPTQGQM
jgi:hypothetical protein